MVLPGGFMEALLSFELTIVELLLIVSVVAVLARRIRVPYTVVLVLVGLLLSFQDYTSPSSLHRISMMNVFQQMD